MRFAFADNRFALLNLEAEKKERKKPLSAAEPRGKSEVLDSFLRILADEDGGVALAAQPYRLRSTAPPPTEPSAQGNVKSGTVENKPWMSPSQRSTASRPNFDYRE